MATWLAAGLSFLTSIKDRPWVAFLYLGAFMVVCAIIGQIPGAVVLGVVERVLMGGGGILFIVVPLVLMAKGVLKPLTAPPPEPRPASTAPEPRPASTAVEPRPASTAVEPRPASTAVEPRSASTAVEPRPASTAVEPRPASTAMALLSEEQWQWFRDRLLQDVTEAHERLLTKVEVATQEASREVITGFCSIFQKAFDLVRNAERELWFINFTPYFGAPHRLNPAITEQYRRETDLSFAGEVDTLVGKLCQKIGTTEITEVAILTLAAREPGGADNLKDIPLVSHFLKPLKDLAGPYERLDVRGELEDAVRKRNLIVGALKNAFDARGLSYRYHECDSLPLQIIIAGRPGAPGNDGKRPCGCLAFMLGTGVLPYVERGTETGFYSERHEVTSVYRQMAEALIRTGKCVAESL